MLKNAIQHVIDDSSFHLKVEAAAEWSGKDENRLIFEARRLCVLFSLLLYYDRYVCFNI